MGREEDGWFAGLLGLSMASIIVIVTGSYISGMLLTNEKNHLVLIKELCTAVNSPTKTNDSRNKKYKERRGTGSTGGSSMAWVDGIHTCSIFVLSANRFI